MPKQLVYKDCIHIAGKHCFIYNQPPAESDIKELQKLFRLLSTMFSAHLIAPKNWFVNKVHWNGSVILVKQLLGHPAFINVLPRN